jgi:ribosome-associated protein
VKARLRALAGHRITGDGALLIIARNHRTQEGNRREALQRLADLVARASIEPRIRRATRPTLGSQERRLESKRERKRTKQLRGRITRD